MRKNRAHGWTKFWRFPLILALLLVFSSLSAVGAAADSESASYRYLIGTGVFAGTTIPLAGPDVSKASDGSTVSLTGQGTLRVDPKSVTGSGSFTEKDSVGNVTASGTWTALRLLNFVSYGNVPPQGLPPQNFGGEAFIRVKLSTGPTAVLTVTCLLGTPPPGNSEGFMLAILGGSNFNQSVSGETDFILLSRR